MDLFSILVVVSCFMWCAVLDSSDLHLSNPITSLASHITILIFDIYLF